jgi:hypothetical protein
MSTLTEALKNQIDNMSHLDMCRIWRFAKSDDPCLAGIAGDYLSRRIQTLGGVTRAINRQMEWDAEPGQQLNSIGKQC